MNDNEASYCIPVRASYGLLSLFTYSTCCAITVLEPKYVEKPSEDLSTASHDPNLPGYRPNLTWQPNVPKIEQCQMLCATVWPFTLFWLVVWYALWPYTNLVALAANVLRLYSVPARVWSRKDNAGDLYKLANVLVCNSGNVNLMKNSPYSYPKVVLYLFCVIRLYL